MNGLISFKFLKYAIVGITGMLIDFSITWICKEKIKLNKYLSNSIGFCLAVTSNYLLNRYWTFADYSTPLSTQYLKFFLVSFIGLGLNNFLLYFFVNRLKKNFYFLKLMVTGIVFIWNYMANFLFTFNQSL